MSLADSLTFLHAHQGWMTKTIGFSGERWCVQGYSAGAFYAVVSMPLTCFVELADTLKRVSRSPRCCVIRGELLPGVNPRKCRRLCDRAVHGDAVTFVPAARRWIGIDVDSLPEPPGCTFAAEPEDGVEHAILQLPEPFHDASCWWQATGSAGIKPGIRARLWFWLSRPVDDAEAKGWLKGSFIDRSLYTPVGLHYVARPILPPGTPDPVIRRQGVRPGLDDIVEVPDLLPRIEVPVAAPVHLDGAELTDDDLLTLARAATSCRTVTEIWSGERSYPDRSTAHFAIAAALARGGCSDPDTIHRVLVAMDRRHGRDTSKIMRLDYAQRTIAAALAADQRNREAVRHGRSAAEGLLA